MARLKHIKECKKCGAEYADFGFGVDKFCRSCGNKLPKPKEPSRCLSCQRIIKTKDSFCSNCGKVIKTK